MTSISTLGAIAALVVAIVLILRKVSPAYGMMAGALVGGLIGGADLLQTVSLMVSGAQGIVNAVLAAGTRVWRHDVNGDGLNHSGNGGGVRRFLSHVT